MRVYSCFLISLYDDNVTVRLLKHVTNHLGGGKQYCTTMKDMPAFEIRIHNSVFLA